MQEIARLRREVERLTCDKCGNSGYATTSESISAGVYCCSCVHGDWARKVMAENKVRVENFHRAERAEAAYKSRSRGLLDGIRAAREALEHDSCMTETTTVSRRFLRVKDLEVQFGLKKPFVLKLCRSGKLRSVKIEGCRLIEAASVRELFERAE